MAEAEASGTARRSTFRTTRYLLAGCRAGGVSLTGLSTVLRVRPESIRARSSMGGIIAATTLLVGSSIERDEHHFRVTADLGTGSVFARQYPLVLDGRIEEFQARDFGFDAAAALSL